MAWLKRSPRAAAAALGAALVLLSAPAARAQLQVSVVALNEKTLPPVKHGRSEERFQVLPGGDSTVRLVKFLPGRKYKPFAFSVNREELLLHLDAVKERKPDHAVVSFEKYDLVYRMPGDTFTSARFARKNRAAHYVLSILGPGEPDTKLTKEQAQAQPKRPLNLIHLSRRIKVAKGEFTLYPLFTDGALTSRLAVLRAGHRWSGPATHELLVIPLEGSASLEAGGASFSLKPLMLARIPRGFPYDFTLTPTSGFFAVLIVSGAT